MECRSRVFITAHLGNDFWHPKNFQVIKSIKGGKIWWIDLVDFFFRSGLAG